MRPRGRRGSESGDGAGVGRLTTDRKAASARREGAEPSVRSARDADRAAREPTCSYCPARRKPCREDSLTRPGSRFGEDVHGPRVPFSGPCYTIAAVKSSWRKACSEFRDAERLSARSRGGDPGTRRSVYGVCVSFWPATARRRPAVTSGAAPRRHRSTQSSLRTSRAGWPGGKPPSDPCRAMSRRSFAAISSAGSSASASPARSA